jgi:hypothetical protein
MVEHALALNQARMDYSAETLRRAVKVAEYSERRATNQGILSKMAAHVRGMDCDVDDRMA